MKTVRWLIVVSVSALALAGCGGGGGKHGGGASDGGSGGGVGGGGGDVNRGEGGGGAPMTFTVGGTVTGLNGTLVLQNNAGDDLTLSASGAFTFATALTTGAAYSVAVKTQPQNQTCTVSSGVGAITANVANVTIACEANAPNTFTVSGTISGLAGTIVLQNSGGSDLLLTTDGPFTFGTPVISGGAYAVSVKTQPANQHCDVANGTGTVTANVSNVAVTCTTNAPNTFSVSGTVSGLPESSHVVLHNIDGSDKTVQGGATFSFGNVPSGTAYGITVGTQPSYPAYNCTVANGAGVVGAAAVNVGVTCTALQRTTLLGAAGNMKRIDLFWQTGDPVSTFNVFYSTTPDCNLAAGCHFAHAVGPGEISYGLVGLTNGTTYYVKVEMVYPNGARDVTPELQATPDSWRFKGAVRAIAVAADGTQYVGGDFIDLQLGSQASVVVTREHVAAFDAAGTLLSWNPRARGGGVVALKVVGNTVYLAGSFTSVGGDTRFHDVAAVDGVAGAPLTGFASPNFTFTGVVPKVMALEVYRDAVYVGGDFRTAVSDFLVALNRADGSPIGTFTPHLDGRVAALLAAEDLDGSPPSILAGGSFTTVGSDTKSGRLARLDANTGLLVQDINGDFFRPNPTGPGVAAIARINGIVYAGGFFSKIRAPGGAPGSATKDVRNLAAVFHDDGVSVDFNPMPNDGVAAFAVAADRIFAGGSFTGSGSRPGFVAAFPLDVNGGPAQSDPLPLDMHVNGKVSALAISGDTLYLGGDFTTAGGSDACVFFCALSATNGLPTR